MSAKLTVQVWSDVACPWCYIGKRRLESALAQFEHRDEVAVHWRSFELDPSAPRGGVTGPSIAEHLALKFGKSVSQAQVMMQQVADVAKKDGLDFHFERARHASTFDAHRLLHLAEKRGVQGALKERLFRAYFTEGLTVSDHAVLERLAVDAGLDADEARALLAGNDHAADVGADQATVQQAGVNGVPFFLIGRYGVSGAQPAHLLLEALRKAWSEIPPAELAQIEQGAVCGPDGCA